MENITITDSEIDFLRIKLAEKIPESEPNKWNTNPANYAKF